MADNVTADSGSGGAVFATDDIGGVHYPITKITFGALDSQTLASSGNGTTDAGTLRVTVASDSTGVLSVDDNGGSLTVDGTVTADAGTGPWPVTDNGGSLTVDGTVTANLGATDNAVLDSIDAAVNGTLTVGSHAVTNAGTFAVQVSDTSFAVADGNALGEGVLVQGDDGTDRKNIHVDATTGDVQVDVTNTVTVSGTVTADAGTGPWPVTDNGGSLTVDGTVAATQSGSWTLGANSGVDIGDVTINNAAGASAVNIQDGGNSITVDGTVAATQSGTWNVTNVSGTVSLPTGAATAANQSTAITALQLLDNTIVAHDAAVSGSTGVNMLGFEARSTAPTAVANADAVRGIATLLGKQVTLPFAIPASTWSYASPSAVTDTADDAAKAAAGAGIRNYITGIQVMNSHASTGTAVVIKDGSTVIWQGYAESAGGGCSATFNPPLRGTANTAVNVANITTSSSTFFNLQGYVAAE